MTKSFDVEINDDDILVLIAYVTGGMLEDDVLTPDRGIFAVYETNVSTQKTSEQEKNYTYKIIEKEP